MATGPHAGSLLSEIKFENFGRFKEATIGIDPLSTSLLGENGRGKTTVLKSIDLFTKLFHEVRNSKYCTTDPISHQCSHEYFSALLGVKDHDLLWYGRDTNENMKISGTISNESVLFEVENEESTVKITCKSHTSSELTQIECPVVVYVSNTGAFGAAPFKLDNQITDLFSHGHIGSHGIYKMYVDNIRDVSWLLGIDELTKINKEYIEACEDWGRKCEATEQARITLNDTLRQGGKNPETFWTDLLVDEKGPEEIENKYEEHLNYEVLQDCFQSQKNQDEAESTMKKKKAQSDETLKDLSKTGTEISRLLDKFDIRKGCKVEFISSGEKHDLQIDINVTEEKKHLTVRLPLSQCDAGLQQVIIIMLTVFHVQKQEGQKPMHLLLDEPVAVFHGNLVKKLLAYLKEAQVSVVLACHAVDTLMACNSIVSLDGQIGPCKIEMDVLSELQNLCRDTTHTSRLMDLSKTLKTKSLLVVENEADTKVLKAWIKKLHPNIAIEDKFVTYSCAGRPKVDSVVRLVWAFDRLFPGKTKEICVRMFILVDRDNKAQIALDMEKETLQDQVRQYSKKVEIKWYCYQKNEQENYFLSATALKSWREKKKKIIKNKKETQEELNGYIDDHFEYLTICKDYRSSLDHALKQMKDSEQKTISKHHRRSEEEIAAWQGELRSSFTNAKEVLKKFGIKGIQQYKELIHEFPSDDIAPEIVTLVEDFLNYFDIPTDTVTAPAATSQEEQTHPLPEILPPHGEVEHVQECGDVHVAPTTDAEGVTLWKCPKKVSQAGLLENPEEGSNACTVIGVHLAHLLHQQDLDPPDTSQALPQEWIQLLTEAIRKGNVDHRAYIEDSARADRPNLDVEEAVLKATGHGRQWEAEKQIGPLRTQVHISEHLSPLKDKHNTAAFYIAAGNTVTCLQTTNGLIVIDTHYHEQDQYGTYVYHATWENLSAIIAKFASPQVGSITFLTKK